MEPKQVWMSRDTARQSRFALRALGGIAAIAALAVVLAAGGTALALGAGLPLQAVLPGLVLGVTALGVALAVGLGRRTARDATVFFLTGDDRLFVLDVRTIARFGHGVAGYLTGAQNTRKLLRALADHPQLLALADEVCRVEALQENPTYWTVRFQARRPGREPAPRSCLLVKGYPDEDLLLRQLERRLAPQSPLEPENARPLWPVCISGAALAGAAALCVLSHPAVGRLPQAVYFPSLGAVLAAVWLFGYFLLRRRRGE